MIIAQAIDVGFAARRAALRVQIAGSAARAMRVGKTFDTRGVVANRLRRGARDQASDVVAACIRGWVARARAALFVIDTRDAGRRGGGLSLAIRCRSATAVAAHAAAFVAGA